MASQKAIRDHIAEVEKLKELARLRIDRIIRSIPPDELALGNTSRLARRITKEAGDALLGEIGDAMAEARKWSRATGLEAITQSEAREIAEGIVREWKGAFEARTREALRDLQRNLYRDVGRGLSKEQVKKALKRDALADKVHEDIARKTKPMGHSLTNEIGQRVRETGLVKTPGKFVWITTEDSRVCSDSFDTACDERHGEVLSAAQWREVGLPGSSVLICSSFGRRQCRCELIASGSREEDLYEKVNVSDAIKRGKDAAADEI